MKCFRTRDDVSAAEVGGRLRECVEAGLSFVARFGFPQNFLVQFEIPDTSEDAVPRNVVSLRRNVEEKRFHQRCMWKILQREVEASCNTAHTALCVRLDLLPDKPGCANLKMTPHHWVGVHLPPGHHQPEDDRCSSPHRTQPAHMQIPLSGVGVVFTSCRNG